MHIINIVPSISEEASGPSYAVIRLCESLTNEGQDLTLATLGARPITPSASLDVKVFNYGFGGKRLGHSPDMEGWLSVNANSGGIDLIHNHSLWMMPNVYAGWVSKKFDVPLIISPHGTLSSWAMNSGSSIKKIFWPLIQRPAISNSVCFHATAMSEYLDIRRLGFKQPVAIIPNGIDIPPIPIKSCNRMRTLLFLGRIHPVKGLDLLLPAWRAVQDKFPDWRLRIVGPGDENYVRKIKQLASDLGLKQVEFSGPLYGEEKSEAYKNADLFVLPSYSENFGVSVAESLSFGVTAIVSHGAPWGGLEKRRAGWWVEIGLNQLISKLDTALSCSSEELSEMGIRGRQWMSNEYSWQKIGRQMSETYQWIVYGGNMPEWILKD